MSQAIWKFPLARGLKNIEAPAGTVWLHAEFQDQHFPPELFVWGRVDTSAPTKPHPFAVIATGESIDGLRLPYLATVQRHGLVFHIHIGSTP